MVVADLGVRPTLKKFFLTSYFNAKYWFNEKWQRNEDISLKPFNPYIQSDSSSLLVQNINCSANKQTKKAKESSENLLEVRSVVSF